MLARGLLPDFSAAVHTQLDAIRGAAHDENSEIRDLRGLLWASIDNDDSRDLDQLSVALRTAGGAVRILVAVADVDAIVKASSAIDDHARANTASVYTAAEIFSMLPERLSTDLTSLGEGQRRLAIITDITIGEAGTVQSSEVYRAVVVNRAKLSYDSLAGWLNAEHAAPEQVLAVPGLDESLRTQDAVAQAMNAVRHEHGVLSLDTSEARTIFQHTELADLKLDPRNRAKDLIENFMIAVNGVTTRYLEQKGFPTLRRVLRAPERWARIVELASDVGEPLPSEPNAAALEAFLQKRLAVAPENFSDLSLSVVKLLGRGEYELGLPGGGVASHFGLAVKDYTHSTAPNRRFPDLITQRLLKAALAGRPQPYSNQELSALAQYCTEQEDKATKIERQVRKSEAALLLESRIGERFDAMVTGASPKGTWARILQPFAEGKIVAAARDLDVGQHVRVELVHTDVERGFIDFARVERP